VHLDLRQLVVPLVAACGLAACNQTHDGQQPVGGSVDSEAAIQRYLRHAYLDLTGKPPTDDELSAATLRLANADNTPTARGELADELIAKPAFATSWVEELENGVFGGNDLEAQYTQVCGLVRATTQACMSCTDADPCACTCSAMTQFATERAQLRRSPTELSDGTASSVIERRYALATGYFFLLGAPETRINALFDDFLGRPAEPDEIENGRAMIFGAIIPGSPAGLMFHKHGATYTDLIDIIFTSEVYRESIVRRVFDRYLARDPDSIELEHFTPTLDANEPDLRSVVRAVVSSREYFEQ